MERNPTLRSVQYQGLLRTHYFYHSGLIISHPVDITNEPERLVDTLNTMTLANLETLSFDPTIHVCDPTCMNTHQDLQVGAIGWVEDDQAQHLSIMSVLARSQGLVSRGTVCYRVRNSQGVEYALKDCWVDADKKRHEVEVLQMVADIPNVVSLVAEWDVNFEEKSDCIELIRAQHDGVTSADFCNRFHRRLLLTPCGEPLTSYASKHELLRACRDFVTAHKAMLDRCVLHGNLSPNNFILHEGKGYFIDFYHAAITQGNSCVRTRSTGTKPYLSMRLLRAAEKGELTVTHAASDDLESLFYIFAEFATMFDGTRGHMLNPKTPIWVEAYEKLGNQSSAWKAGLVLSPANHQMLIDDVTPFFEIFKPVIEEWRWGIFKSLANANDTIHNFGGISHKEVESILSRWVSKIPEVEELPLVSLPPAASSSTSGQAGVRLGAPLPPPPPPPPPAPRRSKRNQPAGSAYTT